MSSNDNTDGAVPKVVNYSIIFFSKLPQKAIFGLNGLFLHKLQSPVGES